MLPIRLNWLLTVILFSITLAPVAAQFQISEAEYLDKVKNGTTYIAMRDTGSLKSKEYKDVFIKYWTYTKFKFINYSDITDYLAEGNSFLSIGGYETTTQMSTLYSNGTSKEGIDYSITHIYLEFWTPSDKYLNRKKKSDPFESTDKAQIGRIDLFTDFPTLSNPQNIYKEDYDCGGHVRNWGVGYLKNYLQVFCTLLTAGVERKLYAGSSDAAKLKALKTQTLYVPDYVLTKFNKFTGDETDKHSESEIFDDYAYKHEMVTNEKLNQMIMTSDEKPFYYLIYVKSSTDKFITVMNSATGEFIYTDYTPVSYNISDKDLKKLSSAIAK